MTQDEDRHVAAQHSYAQALLDRIDLKTYQRLGCQKAFDLSQPSHGVTGFR